METTTILTDHETKSGLGKKGPWTLNLFTDTVGNKYQVFTGDDGIASQVVSLLGQYVKLTYEQQTRGDFTNNVITGVSAETAVEAPQTPSNGTEGVRPTPVPPEGYVKPVDRNAGVARAIEIAILRNETDATLDEILDLAEIFARYGALGERPTAASEPSSAGAQGPTV
jgi:hypothetical protein